MQLIRYRICHQALRLFSALSFISQFCPHFGRFAVHLESGYAIREHNRYFAS
jgi:hypothetical protein